MSCMVEYLCWSRNTECQTDSCPNSLSGINGCHHSKRSDSSKYCITVSKAKWHWNRDIFGKLSGHFRLLPAGETMIIVYFNCDWFTEDDSK